MISQCLVRLNSIVNFSPTKLRQTEFLTNKGINSYLFTEGALNFSLTKRNLLLIRAILKISHQPVGEKCLPHYLTWMPGTLSLGILTNDVLLSNEPSHFGIQSDGLII